MIRVLQLPGSLTRDNGRMSVIMNIYRNIDREKIQFDFAGTGDLSDEYIDEIKSLGGKVFLLKESGVFGARKLIKDIFNSYLYTIVHYHQMSEFGMTFDVLKKKGVKKIIMHSHATVMSETWWKVPRNRLFSLPVLFYSDKNIAVSNEAGNKLFLSKNFEFIPNAIDQNAYTYDTKVREQIRRRLDVTDRDYLIGNVGRFAKQKNKDFLIPVMKQLVKKSNRYKFLFIGDGELKDSFKKLVYLNGLENNVIILNSTPDIKKYYSAMDLFVLPSLFEGLPMVGVEAQANGLSVLAANTITPQLKITNTKFLSISDKDAVSYWVNEIEKSNSRIDDEQVKRCFSQKGFLTKSAVNTWEKMYFTLLN